MTLKQQLLQEIESTPDSILIIIFNFLRFLKQQQTQPDSLQPPVAEPILRGSKAKDLLKFAGTWQGDDFEECLQSVCDNRSPAQF
ncbi:MAG: hypothetical protein HC942_22230 [Microcoleus sp. SU_5_6]|nr:hypothetical protein [Microcoleus sp. SU_5_6]NJL68162.1 hypothetical protein [Microcoleus sp. SM1_3_4]